MFHNVDGWPHVLKIQKVECILEQKKWHKIIELVSYTVYVSFMYAQPKS